MTIRILTGDVRERLAELPDGSVQCCVTSPPYFGLRDYGTASWDGGDPACDHTPDVQPWAERPNPGGSRIGNGGSYNDQQDAGAKAYRDQCRKCGAVRVDRQIGLESTLAAYVETLVAVFREVRRVLRGDGTVWLNLGDSYAGSGPRAGGKGDERGQGKKDAMPVPIGLKPKDLMMVPARVAIALQEPWERHVISSIADRAWMAGLVDGEGCFTVQAVRVAHSINESHSVRLQVRMADVEAVERIVAITGMNQVTYDQMPPSHEANGMRPAQQWKISGDRMADIAADIYPFLTVKRKQAIVAWNLQRLRDGVEIGRGKPVPEANMEKRRALHDVMRRLNAREHVDIPSWCREPKFETEPGWYLRSSIIWAKRNCMPESVTDRPTSSHEHIFLLTKNARYYYDAEAVREPHTSKEQFEQQFGGVVPHWTERPNNGDGSRKGGGIYAMGFSEGGRNQRNVWHLATEPFPDAHFATFPTEIPRRCIKAGTSEKGQCAACGAPWVRVVERPKAPDELRNRNGAKMEFHARQVGSGQKLQDWYDENPAQTTGWQQSCTCDAGTVPQTVLDPFLGSGTTLLVADQLGRHGVGIELNPEYAAMAEQRIRNDAPMFAEVLV